MYATPSVSKPKARIDAQADLRPSAVIRLRLGVFEKPHKPYGALARVPLVGLAGIKKLRQRRFHVLSIVE